jgi:hypothetical protein
LFDIFLEREPLQLDKNESLNWEHQSLVENFSYTNKDTEFIEFAGWAAKTLSSREFLEKANEFIEIERQLKNEPVGQRRTELVNRSSRIKYG